VIQKKKPENPSTGLDGHLNRTGIGASPLDAKRMIEGATGEPAMTGGPDAKSMRRLYLEEAEPVGTMPPPTTLKGAAETVKQALKGAKATALIDKLGERLAFERTGTRLYDALIGKFEALGGFDGGPTLELLQRFRDEEHAHFVLIKETIESLGADPTAVTPSANLAAVESMGIVQTLGDPRTTLAQSLHAILVAELADGAGWELLMSLARELKQDALADRFEAALKDEAIHLQHVRGWVAAHASLAARPLTKTT
jgi:hypothetical protein